MNVNRVVHEQIARILIPPVAVLERPPDPVHRTASIGVEKPAREVAGVLRHDLFLPRLKLDATFVLPSGAMLREQARPVLRNALDIRARSRFLRGTENRGRLHDECRRLAALLDQARPGIGAGYPQHIRFRSVSDVAVPEVKTEEIRIGCLVKGPPVAPRAVGQRFPYAGTSLTLSSAITASPVPDRPGRYAADLGVFSIKNANIRKLPCDVDR